MADLIIKPNSATGDKLILQDRAGGAVLTTASSGASIKNIVIDPVSSAPGSPITGQLYYNNTTGSLEIYVGTKWEILATNLVCEYLVIGGGGSNSQAGGGAGGYRLGSSTLTTERSGGNSMPEAPIALLKGTNYTVTVGAGGGNQTDGSPSQFASIISYGGGGNYQTWNQIGSGFGGKQNPIYSRLPGSMGTIGQGCDGGYTGENSGSYRGGGGGGGASTPGGYGASSNSTTLGGAGGRGLTSAITGSNVDRGGGGGGATLNGSSQTPGTASHGGGAGTTGGTGTSGTVNTGGGAGGANNGGTGGSGLVVISYLNTYPNLTTIHTSHVCNGQAAGGTTAPSPSTARSGYKTYSFTAGSGNISW